MICGLGLAAEVDDLKQTFVPSQEIFDQNFIKILQCLLNVLLEIVDFWLYRSKYCSSAVCVLCGRCQVSMLDSSFLLLDDHPWISIMTHVYLRHENAAGSGDGVELYPGKSYFLPNDVPGTQAIDVVEHTDATHSMTKLGGDQARQLFCTFSLLTLQTGIYERDVLISSYGPSRIEVLEGGGSGRYMIPISNIAEQREVFIVLRKDDQILTPSGRWSLLWRTGESQMVAPASLILPVGVRSFDVTSEVRESLSPDDEAPVSHGAIGNFVISMEDNEWGEPALASVLMPPPPLPAMDIVLDIPETDENDRTIAEAEDYKAAEKCRTQEKPPTTSGTMPLSQGTRAALAEISINPVIMLRRNGSPSSRARSLLSGSLFSGEDADLQYPENAKSALKQQIDDINGRRILQSGEHNHAENDLPDHTFAVPRSLLHSSAPLPVEGLSPTPRSSTPPSFSTSSGKRKAKTYSSKDNPPNKRSKVSSEESQSYQEDREKDCITVQVTPTRKAVASSKDKKAPASAIHTDQTTKPAANSNTPESSSKSAKRRNGKRTQTAQIDSTSSRPRSSSKTSLTHFEEYLGAPPKVLFTSSTKVDRKKDTMKDFKKFGVQVVTEIDQANMLVVGGTELKKTAKLIIAIAQGMDVVHERWVVESRRKNFLLDIIPFVPQDDVHESEWGFTLVDAITRGKEGIVQELLQDITVHTTKDFERFPAAEQLPSVVKALGGKYISSSLPLGMSSTQNCLILGIRQDSQAVEVQQIGHKLFDKDLIILGAFRGKIDTETPEFEIGVPVKEEESD